MENQENKSFQKKNSKKGVIAIIAVIAVIVLAVGIWGISAYLTDRQSATNTFTVGQVSIELLEPSWVANNASELTANQELPKDPQIKNTGSNPAYVYLKVTIPKEIIRRNSTTKEELFTVSYNGTTGINTADWDLLKEEVGEDSVVRIYYYQTNNGILNANATTNPLFDTIKLANITDGANLEGQSFNVQVDAYAIQSNNLDIPASATTTKLKAQYAWEKYWEQDAEINTPAVVETKIGNRTISQILAEDGYAGLYGTEVKYQNKTFRVFYVEDSSNKFGEGEGTIYLKANQFTIVNLSSVYSNYSSSSTKIRTVNPEWAIARGNVAESSWQENEKETAYLCDPTVETWSNYIDQSAEEVNWVIGAPSAEMYMKSYSQYKNNSYDARYTASGTNGAGANGYQYSLDGSSYANSQSNAIANDNAMYIKSAQYWWLASPSARDAYRVCYVNGYSGNVDGIIVGSTYGVCPLVSLKSGVSLELAD